MQAGDQRSSDFGRARRRDVSVPMHYFLSGLLE
jgi:hypothetical protein